MPTPLLSGEPICCDIDDLLGQLTTYIIYLAWKKIPRAVVPLEVLDLEIDEIVQNTRIKLWLALQKGPITNPKAYIRRVVYTESVDMVRRYKHAHPLPINDEGELNQGNVIVISSEGMQDPADEIEQEETLADFTSKMADGVLSLPPRQQQAMVFMLKEAVTNIIPVVDALLEKGLDVEAAPGPEGKDELQLLRASLVVARKKLRLLNNYE